MQSKYCYPGSNTLINHLNIQDGNWLWEVEKVLTTIRLIELDLNPLKGPFDLKHLQAIHHYIFQDLYPFSGKLREEHIAKDYFQFAHPLFIGEAFQDLYRQLKRDGFLQGLPKATFSKKLAYYMAEINVIHPFREGNGRTTREYIRYLAMASGYTLDWRRVDHKELLEASKVSIVNTEKLEKLLFECLIEAEPSEEVVERWKKSRRARS